MKFRWRRHSAQVVDTEHVVPEHSQQQIFEIIHGRMSQYFGSTGTWVVSKRTAADTDSIFQDFLAQSLARELAAVLGSTSDAKPVSPDWVPEPIAVWSDGSSAPVTVIPQTNDMSSDIRPNDADQSETVAARVAAERLVA